MVDAPRITVDDLRKRMEAVLAQQKRKAHIACAHQGIQHCIIAMLVGGGIGEMCLRSAWVRVDGMLYMAG